MLGLDEINLWIEDVTLGQKPIPVKEAVSMLEQARDSLKVMHEANAGYLQELQGIETLVNCRFDTELTNNVTETASSVVRSVYRAMRDYVLARKAITEAEKELSLLLLNTPDANMTSHLKVILNKLEHRA